MQCPFLLDVKADKECRNIYIASTLADCYKLKLGDKVLVSCLDEKDHFEGKLFFEECGESKEN